jgi:Tfp pilus assembly protein PilF
MPCGEAPVELRDSTRVGRSAARAARHACPRPETEGLETMTFPPTSFPRHRAIALAGVALSLIIGSCSASSKPGAKDTTALLNRGLRAQVSGDLSRAEKDFKKVIEADPANKVALYDLGLIYQTQGKTSDSEARYRQALAIDPKYLPALLNLGILRANADDVTGAIDLYRRAIAVSETNADAHYNLGVLLRMQKQIAEGNAQIRTAVNLDPSLRQKAIGEGVPLTGS